MRRILEKYCSGTIPGEPTKRPGVLKILLPEYQSNDIENCLVLFPICLIRLSNLPGFNRLFLPVEMGDLLQKASFENLQNRVKTTSKISLSSPPSNNDTWMCTCILSSWENGISLNKLFIPERRLFQSLRRTAGAKAY